MLTSSIVRLNDLFNLLQKLISQGCSPAAHGIVAGASGIAAYGRGIIVATHDVTASQRANRRVTARLVQDRGQVADPFAFGKVFVDARNQGRPQWRGSAG